MSARVQSRHDCNITLCAFSVSLCLCGYVVIHRVYFDENA